MTNEELADALDLTRKRLNAQSTTSSLDIERIDNASQRLRDTPDGERIEGCEIGSSLIRDNYGGDSVTVKLPPGGSLHKMLLEPCTLIIHERKEEGDE